MAARYGRRMWPSRGERPRDDVNAQHAPRGPMSPPPRGRGRGVRVGAAGLRLGRRLALASALMAGMPGTSAGRSAADQVTVLLEHAEIPPSLVVSCDPAADALGAPFIRAFIEERAEEAGYDVSAALSGDSSDPLSLDPQGAAVVMFWEGAGGPDAIRLGIPMRESRANLLTALAKRRPDLAPGEDGALPLEGPAPLSLWVGDRRLSLRSPHIGPTPRPSPPDLDLTRGMPSGPGCALYLDLRGAQDDPGTMAAYVPLSAETTAPMVVRLRPSRPLPEGAVEEHPPLPAVASVAEPLTVMSLSARIGHAELEALAAAPLPPSWADLKDALSALAASVPEGITLAPGLAAASFEAEEGTALAVRLPLVDGRGRPLSRRQLRRLASATGEGAAPASREGRGLYRDPRPGARLPWRAFTSGTLVVASTRALAEDVASAGGAPWFSDYHAAVSQGYALTLTLGPAARARLGPEAAGLALGLTLKEGYAELRVDAGAVPTGPFLMATASALLGDDKGRLTLITRRAEARRTVDAIYEAELAHHEATGRWLPLPAAPREEAALDAQRAPWDAQGGWEELGLRRTAARGSYEVEVSEAGFTIRGAIDADGDGIPARYWRALGEPEATRLTPADVF